MKNALISVFDKTGIVEFAQALVQHGYNIYASSGTYKYLLAAGIENLFPVSDLVHGDPILGHRVATLSREVAAGCMAKYHTEQMVEIAKLMIPCLDLVCVDMYPLEAEIAKSGSTLESVIEQTDIGGPTMIRCGAKGRRIVICDPKDRQKVIDWIKAGEPANAFVGDLCAKGEFTVAKYVMASARYLSDGRYEAIFGERVATCRYGENAWQKPAHHYSTGTNDPLAIDNFKLIEGTSLSYNNLLDLDRTLQTITHIAAAYSVNQGKVPSIAVGAKHGNPCGSADDFEDSALVLQTAVTGDELAIFGGTAMVNFDINGRLADVLFKKGLDVIVAPSFSPDAIDKLRRKENKCHFVVNPNLHALDANSLDMARRFRYVRGGFLTQPNYTFVLNLEDERITKYGRLTPEQRDDMLLAWSICATSNSNTITLVNNGQLIGNGVGQQDRVGAAELAIKLANRAKHIIVGAVACSDSFFPFPDGPQALIEAGVSAIFTTSGSKRDNETIKFCKSNGIVLYMIPDEVGRGFFGH